MVSSSHSDIARDLADGIRSGRFAVGSLLPTEFELCERYAASRYGVRRALHELQQLGLISRRKNVGTRVIAAVPVPGFVQSIATVEELAQFGAEHLRMVQSVETVRIDADLAEQLGCRAGERRLRISSLRMEAGTPGRPIGWTDAYVPRPYAAVGELARRSPTRLISSLIEERFGLRITRIAQEIQATDMPESLAEALQARAGSPALRIVRRYLDDQDETIETSVTLHPADRFTFSTMLNRGSVPEPR